MLTPDDARRLAAEITAAFGRIPGLLEIRFFGDFETGVDDHRRHGHPLLPGDLAGPGHARCRMASEPRLKVRDLVARYTEERPSWERLADYSVR